MNEEGLFEHNMHIKEARAVLFKDYAFDRGVRLRSRTWNRACCLGGSWVACYLEWSRHS